MSFNFDLERMKEAVESGYYKPPKNQNFEEFTEWMNNLDKEDKYFVNDIIGEQTCQQH